jgi:hypothetical protein
MPIVAVCPALAPTVTMWANCDVAASASSSFVFVAGAMPFAQR